MSPSEERNMISLPTLVSAIIYSTLLSLMSVGLTLTYITTKVPNVAQGVLVTIGAYAVFTGVMFLGGSPYIYLPLAFLVSGAVATLLYCAFVNPLRKRGSSVITLMIATLSFDVMVFGFVNVYADYLQRAFGLPSKKFLFRRQDFSFLGQPGILLASVLVLTALLASLHLILRHTKLGLVFRATAENPTLSKVVGADVDRVYLVSWFIAGGLAGLAGGFLPSWFQVNPSSGDAMIADMFAVSILGGLEEIYGAFLGGFLIGFAEIFVTLALARAFGPWVIKFKPLIPMVALVLTLLFMPGGLVGGWKRLAGLRKFKGEER